MSLACPVCKAENAAGSNCRRCKAELAMLHNVEECRAYLLAATRQAFEQNRQMDAWRYAIAANEHRQDAESLRWVAMLHLIHGNFEDAWHAYQARNPHV